MDKKINPFTGEFDYIGPKLDIFTAGENLVDGEICVLKVDGKVYKAKADVVSTVQGLIIMALSSISSNTTGLFLLEGDHPDTNLTVGSEYFISVTTAGAKTATRPSTAGNMVKILGYATTSTNFYFCPDRTYIKI